LTPVVNNRGIWQTVARWFLFLSYAAGAPAFAYIEYRTGMSSARFDYSPEFLYLVSAMQFVCAFLLFKRNLALWSIAVLTVLTIGAAASHVMINSPLAALPALAYTAIQVWYGLRLYRQDHARGA